MKQKLTMLMILDGFGENTNKDGNAIELAKVNGVLLWDRKKLQALLKNTEN